MEILSYIRIFILLVSTVIFIVVLRKLVGTNVRGIAGISIGFSLQSEAILNALSDIGEGFVIVEGTRIVHANQAFQQMSGYTENELNTIDSFYNLLAPDGRAILTDCRQTKNPNKFVPGRYGTAMVHKNGKQIHLEVAATSLVMDGKRQTIILVRDISGRRQAEENYHNIFENASEGIYQSTPSGKLISANMALAKIYGYNSTAELISSVNDISADLFVNPDDRIKFTQWFETHDELQDFQYEAYRKNGRKIWVSESSRAVYDQHRNVQYYEGFVKDITERKQTEIRASIFASLAHQLNTAITPKDAGTIFMNMADKIFQYDACTFDLFSSEESLIQSVLNVDRINGERVRIPPSYLNKPPSQRMLKVIETGGELILRDDATAFPPEAIPFGDVAKPSASIMTVPMRNGLKVIGILSIQSYALKSYTYKDLEILQSLADHCGGALERIKAENALIASQSKYRQVIETASHIIYSLDNNGNFTYANGAALETSEYSLEELKHLHYFDLILPEHNNKVRRTYLRQYIEKQTSSYVEFPFQTKSGKVRWFGQNATLIIEMDNVVGFHVIARDITDRKQAEDALRQSEERYRSLIDSAQDIILTISPQAFISSLNPAFDTLTNWKRGEWLGKSFTDLIHPNDLPKAIDLFHTILEGRSKGTAEYRLRTASGEYLITELTMTPQLQNGVIVGVLAIARDITVRKSMDEHIQQSQKMDSIGTLAGGIAHDFNNILAIIMGYISMLEQSNNSERFAMSIGAITKAVRRGADLVRQILTLARKTEVTLEPVLVNDSVNELCNMLNDTFPKTIEIQLDLDPKNPVISICPTQLLQLLLNLCVNARDAMLNKGKLKIKTRFIPHTQLRGVHPNVSGQDYVMIRVADTGFGMDEETKRRIFEPFFTTKERGKGTGLGLAVVYGVVQNAGGFITVDSEPGNGTSFNLYFPYFTLSGHNDQSHKAQTSVLPRGNETILVIEDEEPLLDLLTTLLTSQGFKVLQAKNGIEAVAVYTTSKDDIACIISDIGLPKLSGPDAITKIKNINPTVKTIVASGYLEPRIKSELVAKGIQEFIQKPYELQEVLGKIRKIIDNSIYQNN